jgi:Tfp pilus assembly protein PilF
MEQSLISSGLESFLNDDFKTAIDNFSKALEKNADNIDCLVYRAVAYIKVGQNENAITDLNNAEKIEKRFDVLYNRGKAYFYNEEFDKATTDLKEALEVKDISDERKSLVQNLLNKMH